MSDAKQMNPAEMQEWQRDLYLHRVEQAELETRATSLARAYQRANHAGAALLLMKDLQDTRRKIDRHRDAADDLMIRLRAADVLIVDAEGGNALSESRWPR